MPVTPCHTERRKTREWEGKKPFPTTSQKAWPSMLYVFFGKMYGATLMCVEFIYVRWARIFRPFKETRNRCPAWRAGMTTLFLVPARQASQPGEIDTSESIPGLHKRLQIRALAVRGGPSLRKHWVSISIRGCYYKGYTATPPPPPPPYSLPYLRVGPFGFSHINRVGVYNIPTYTQ